MRRVCSYCDCTVQLYNKDTSEYLTIQVANVPYFIDVMEARQYIEDLYPNHICINIKTNNLPITGYITMSNETYLRYGTQEIRKSR